VLFVISRVSALHSDKHKSNPLQSSRIENRLARLEKQQKWRKKHSAPDSGAVFSPFAYFFAFGNIPFKIRSA